MLYVLLFVFLIILVDSEKNNSNTEKRSDFSYTDISKLKPYENEEYVADLLRRRGFSNVRITPKSKDYGADILAIAPNGKTVCVQCKKYSKPIGIKAVQEVLSAQVYYGCELACVIATNTFTPQAEKMAKKAGVRLFTMKQ